MAVARKRTTVKRLVERARVASGNAKFALHRLPKNPWMRNDAAKAVRKGRIGSFGGKNRGIPAISYS